MMFLLVLLVAYLIGFVVVNIKVNNKIKKEKIVLSLYEERSLVRLMIACWPILYPEIELILKYADREK